MDDGKSLFETKAHPFVWFAPAEREAILANARHPVWGRFLGEVEAHFARRGELTRPVFPVFCHDGDLDEVMALSILAFVQGEKRHWQWIGEWLGEMAAYARTAMPLWREHRNLVLQGDWKQKSNPRQYFEGFTRGGLYWVEGGLMSSVLHLLDLLESEAPWALGEEDKTTLLAALSDFADRYAFNEEGIKYSNRGVWANAGLLISAITCRDSLRAKVLLLQCQRRNEELRSTFFDDGLHAEGSPDYHMMAADGVLCYTALAASALEDAEAFAGGSF